MVVPLGGDTIGVIIAGLAGNVFGAYDLALVFILLFVLAMCAAFRIPFEFSAVLVVPLGLAMAWWASAVWSFVGILVLYLGFMLYKYWPVRVG